MKSNLWYTNNACRGNTQIYATIKQTQTQSMTDLLLKTDLLHRVRHHRSLPDYPSGVLNQQRPHLKRKNTLNLKKKKKKIKCMPKTVSALILCLPYKSKERSL